MYKSKVMNNQDVHRQIKCTSENKLTRNRIDVELWNDEFEPELPLVVVVTNREMLHLAIQDIPGLIIALISLLVKRKFKKGLNKRELKNM